MSDTERALVVLIDADDLRFIFAEWPDHICLATCLFQSGECAMHVFRRDEQAEMPLRLMNALNLQAQRVCFVPGIPGYATKKFLYSDERRLMTLIASDNGVLEDALDYSVNYNYALEEGLDPAVLLGTRSFPAEENVNDSKRLAGYRGGSRITKEATNAASLVPEFLRRSADRTCKPQFASRRSGKPFTLAQV